MSGFAVVMLAPKSGMNTKDLWLAQLRQQPAGHACTQDDRAITDFRHVATHLSRAA